METEKEVWNDDEMKQMIEAGQSAAVRNTTEVETWKHAFAVGLVIEEARMREIKRNG